MSVQQATDVLSAAKVKVLEWYMACIWFVLFSIGALCTAILASLVNSDWDNMNHQSKFLMVVAIVGSWTNTMLAFFSKAAKKVERQIMPDDGTQFVTRIDSTTQTVKVSQTPPIDPPNP